MHLQTWYKALVLGFITSAGMIFSVNAKCVVADKAISEGRFADAISYYQMCINNGEAEAPYKLGSLYYQGKGGKKADRKRARSLFKTAAERGNTSAQALLGVMLISGDGGEVNRTEGYKWLLLANEKPGNKWFYLQNPGNETKVKSYLERAGKSLTNEEKAKSKQLAAEWKTITIAANAKKIFASSASEYESFINRYNSAGPLRREAIADFTAKVQNKEYQR